MRKSAQVTHIKIVSGSKSEESQASRWDVIARPTSLPRDNPQFKIIGIRHTDGWPEYTYATFLRNAFVLSKNFYV